MIKNEGLAAIEIHAECEDQLSLTEQQELEIQRLQHLMEVQREFVAALQADFDALAVFLRIGASPPQPKCSTSSNDHDQAYQHTPEVMSSGDHQ